MVMMIVSCVLCNVCRDKKRVRHYKVEHLKSGKFILTGESKVHQTLQYLVEYYQKVQSGILLLHCDLFYFHD